jgi:uncharacterized protein YraI
VKNQTKYICLSTTNWVKSPSRDDETVALTRFSSVREGGGSGFTSERGSRDKNTSSRLVCFGLSVDGVEFRYLRFSSAIIK